MVMNLVRKRECNMKFLTLASLLLAFLNMGLSQNNWEEFKNEKSQFYASLETADIENFSFLISSSEYIGFIQDKADSTFFYPLKIIWTKNEKVYYIMQPFPPNLADSTKQQLTSKLEELKKVFKGTLADWQQLSLYSPFHDIPGDATISFGQDTVGISYRIEEDNNAVSIKQLFSRAGELARIIWRGEGLRIVTYPYYKEIQDKWVCQGWRTQFYNGGEITSGMAVVLGLGKFRNYWLPTQINIIAQSKAKPNQRSVVKLFLRDYIFNQKFEIVSQPSETTEPK